MRLDEDVEVQLGLMQQGRCISGDPREHAELFVLVPLHVLRVDDGPMLCEALVHPRVEVLVLLGGDTLRPRMGNPLDRRE